MFISHIIRQRLSVPFKAAAPPYRSCALRRVVVININLKQPIDTLQRREIHRYFLHCVQTVIPPFSRRQSTLGRNFSSRRKEEQSNDFKLDALSFSVAPEQALQRFQTWAVDEQGLNYLIQWSSIRIGAAYVPVWSFNINLRFVTEDPETKRKRYDLKPQIFSVYGADQAVIHVPGLSAYAGYNFRRSLIHPIHSTTLVFMGGQTVPFGKWMLRDMKLENGQRLEVVPDPWNATRSRAWQVLRDELQGICSADLGENSKMQVEVLSARRVYMPTYVVEYKILGMEYQAFVSGCDAGAGVSGVSHQLLPSAGSYVPSGGQFVSQVNRAVQTGLQYLGMRQLGTVVLVLFQFLGSLVARLWTRVPILGLIGGLFVGFRKIVQPWMDQRWASAQWERQREHESYVHHDDHVDDFVDSGSAKRYFEQNRARILRHLSGEQSHEQGNFDWYKEWEEWARQQWQQQQQQQYGSQQTYQKQQQRQQTKRSKPQQEYQWDFDKDDPYSVLGIRRGATKEQVSAAFRKEMMKHHPDVAQAAGASDAEKARAVEHSKLITEAYRKIKAEMKR